MTTEEKLQQIMIEKPGLEQPGSDASFSNDPEIDSLDIFEMIIEVENVFDISIPSEDAEKLVTPAKLIEYIKSNATEN